MRTKTDAAQTLIEAGWTPRDVKFILGNVLETEKVGDVPAPTPWWSWVGEEWYTNGSPIVPDWEAWMAEQRS